MYCTVAYRSRNLLLRRELGDETTARVCSDALPQSNAIELIDGLVLRKYVEVWSPNPLSNACRLTDGLVPQVGVPTWFGGCMVISFVGSLLLHLQAYFTFLLRHISRVTAHLVVIFHMF